MFHSLRHQGAWVITLAAAGILMLTMGTRQSFGLFISPMNVSTGLSVATISFALAVGQFTWGVIQPVAGAAADRYGSKVVLVAAVVMLAAGCIVTPFMGTGFGLIVSLGILASVGSGAGSFSVLIGAVSQRLPIESRGVASGVINAGGSFGQFIAAPVFQKLIQIIGWTGAMWCMAIAALLALPMVSKLTAKGSGKPVRAAGEKKLRTAVAEAMFDRNYVLLNIGFFTCGFHVAFLTTHLPGEVGLCGLPPSVASWSLAIIGLANIFGSIYAGSCIVKYRSKCVLANLYGLRALLIGWYLLMPRDPWVFYVFSAGMGLTFLATVPPTAAIVGKLFGTRYLATLFGLTLLSHQVGGFLGAWLGGLAITEFGDFTWMWYADMVLALLAALVNLPIKEARVVPPTAQGSTA